MSRIFKQNACGYRMNALLLFAVIFISVYTTTVFAATCKTLESANLRGGPSTDSKILGLVGYGTQIELVSKGSTWSKVSYNGTTGYIRNDLLEFPKNQAASNSSGSSSSALKNGDSGDSVKELQQLLAKAGVYTGPANGKFGPLTEEAVRKFQKNQSLTVDGIVGSGTMAKLKSVTTPKETAPAETKPAEEVKAATPVTPPQNANAVDDSAILGLIVEEGAIKRGNSGDKVGDVQTLLTLLGYYTGGVDCNFGAQTEIALKAFQSANGLTADGACGSATLNKLISPSAVTAAQAGYDPSKAPKTLVELTPWSEAKQIFTIGANAQVYDCKTGITYYVRSFSNGSHADVEPITVQDTEKLKQTYGGTWSWTPRPVWVTVNGKTMAASINGMPHGGGINANNGMDGQVCIHFKGSATHNGNGSFGQAHQDAAVAAYNMAQ